MARLHEYQGKEILARHGLSVPKGGAAATSDEARRIAASLGGKTVVKIQAWTTNRKALGGVAFASTPDEAGTHAGRMLKMHVGNFPVTHVLVEELLPIQDELFISFFIDDRERGPA
ncbi:MAG: acetate--CoA ligase family protein, partial [Pyrinomonadaceae bacterium]|nr:acetate--CoA ligase family protein [Phycisphaerales bacterium]